MKPLRIAALVKQVPKFEEMQLGEDGRLQREGMELSLNPYCQRAVSKGVELAQQTAGTCTIISLGPPPAEDVIRWGIAWGADNGILISDPAFAGSDTLATARALAAVVKKEGPFDLILVGKNSVDADTGQVGPELAELLDYPFASAVRKMELNNELLQLGCEHDDSWVDIEVSLPAVLSTAERLCDPAKVPPEARQAVAADRVKTLTAADLAHIADFGQGPWGQEGSPTWVGETKVLEVARQTRMLDGTLADQIDQAVAIIKERGALEKARRAEVGCVAPPVDNPAATVVVLMEPDRPGSSRELLGAASHIAERMSASVLAVQVGEENETAPQELYAWGADQLVVLNGVAVEEDIAHGVSGLCEANPPWCILAPSTSWGREVSSRIAARLDAGLTGDAVQLDVEDDKLVSWKPAFGGRLVAAIRASSAVQMATVRPGVLSRLTPREQQLPQIEKRHVEPRSRLRVLARQQNDQLDNLALASRVVGIGQGIPPERYTDLDPLLHLLDAEIAVTRKVTDKGWMPHARQVGITGRSISPNLYIALAIGGKFNHSCGIQSSGTILAINSDPEAPIFGYADIGIVADWSESVPLLVKAFEQTGV